MLLVDSQNVADTTTLKMELKQWQEVYRETVLRSGSTSYCQGIIDQIKADIDRLSSSNRRAQA